MGGTVQRGVLARQCAGVLVTTSPGGPSSAARQLRGPRKTWHPERRARRSSYVSPSSKGSGDSAASVPRERNAMSTRL
ncbi:hypothetical protein AURDEDRAFT_115564 [Auricularia subglabra TFB-10046 SS5]|nr:hypothetical protein AURDEDRAFT_115564 [Auricularia subglabra TFB-10046 SS5]